MEKHKLILIIGAIILVVGLILLMNGVYWYLFTQGEYTFTEAGMSRIIMSLPVVFIGVMLVIISIKIK